MHSSKPLRHTLALFTLGIATLLHAAEEPANKPRIDYLQGFVLAQQGNNQQALRNLAASLRDPSNHNPAAGLAFELLAKTRAGTSFLLRGHTGDIYQVLYSPDGSLIATVSADKTARVWNASTGRLRFPPLKHDATATVAAFSPDSAQLATGADDGKVRVWNTATGKLEFTVGHDDPVRFVKFSPGGSRIVSTADNEAIVWDAKTGRQVMPLFHYRDGMYNADFSPDGKRLTMASGDDRTDVLDVATGRPMFKPIRHGNGVMTCVFSNDGKRLLTASADGSARIWDSTTGQPAGPIFKHDFWVFSAIYSPDNTRVATASSDNTARIWDAKTGDPVTPPLLHNGTVTSTAFSPDGTRIVTMSRDGTAALWDARTGDAIALPIQNFAEGRNASFDARGSLLAVALKDHTVRILPVPPSTPPPAWLAELAGFASKQNTYVQTAQSAVPDFIMRLREKLLLLKTSDPWEKFGQWYFTEADMRPVVPGASVSLKEYVDALIEAGDAASLDYAISLSKGQPAWMVKLIPLREKLTAKPQP